MKKSSTSRRSFLTNLATGGIGMSLFPAAISKNKIQEEPEILRVSDSLPQKKFVPVMITPFKQDNSIDFSALGALTDFYLAAGVKGFFANCQSSEMYALNAEERLGLARFVVRKANGSLSVVATGSFGNSDEEKAGFIQRMYHTGVNAVILITSHFAAATESDDVLYENFIRIFEKTDNIPLGMYECPAPYKRLITPPLFKKLLATNRLFYHKDTSLDFDKVKAKIDLVGNSRLEFFDAHAPNTMNSLKAGARGMSAIAGNFYPEIFVWMCNNALDPQKQDTVRWLQSEITRADSIVSDGYPMSSKYILQKRGLPIQPISRISPNPLKPEQKLALDGVYKSFLGWCERLGIQPVKV